MIEYIEDACIHIKIYQGINNGRLGCASGTFRLGVRDAHTHVLFYTALNIAHQSMLTATNALYQASAQF